ncbi:hypothetical protein ACFLQ0_00940 [Nitrospinota bacterium]
MQEVSHNEVKYQLETRDHDLYGFGVDVFMMETDGSRPKEPIAFIPGRDENSAVVQTQQWLKIAFPAEPQGKKK